MPQILVEKGNISLYGGGEVVLGDLRPHSSFVEVIDFVEDHMDTLLEVASRFAVPSVKLAIELDHGVLSFCIPASASVLDEFEDAILNEYDSHFFRRDAFCL